MLNKQLKNSSQSKLSKALNQIVEDNKHEKTGFITKINKTSLFKTKSFRLRESDLKNFENIASYVNKSEDRKIYSDSQIIRGIINYFSNNIDSDFEKIIEHIRGSS